MLLEQAAQLPAADAQPLCQGLDAGFVVVQRALGDPRQKARSGAISGRQRRQGLKPASCAAAAEAKNRQFSNFGVRAGQIGRQ